MSQQSYSFNKPLPYFQVSGVYGNVNPTPPPTVLGVVVTQGQGVDITPGWYTLSVGLSTKTPKPWPNGKPSLKQWNSYNWNRTVYECSTASVRFEATLPPFAGQLRFREVTGSYERGFNSLPLPSVSVVPDQAGAALKVLNKIKAQDWNVGESLGEIAQTAGLVVNSMNRIANAILAVKQGKVRKAMKILNVRTKQALGPAQRRAINRKFRTRRERQIASEWLSINYGVLPLADDIKNAIDHLQNRSDWPIQTQASVTVSAQEKRKETNNTGTVAGKSSYIGTVTSVAKAKYVLQYEVDSPTVAYFRSLGLTNMPSLAWELTPGSLIVDWFLPISKWLSAMDATFGCRFLKGVYVQRITTRYHVEAWLSSIPGAASTGVGKKIWSTTTYQRTRLTSFPLASFPRFKNPVSAMHLANGLAFLVQAVHR